MEEECKRILVCSVLDIRYEAQPFEHKKKVQVLHMYNYEVHLYPNKIWVEEFLKYIEEQEIMYVCIHVEQSKKILDVKSIINYSKKKNKKIKIICTGEALTEEIAKDIGADAYTPKGSDAMQIIDLFDEEEY